MTEYRKNRLIDIARSLYGKKNGKNFHVSFILKNNKILSIGVNNYKKRHLENRFGRYVATRSPDGKYISSIHSEIDALRIFINRFGTSDCSGLTLFNVRLGTDFAPLLAKCCANCQKVMDALNFKEILYTL